MTPDERQMITGLFDRLRQQGVVDKDRDAEALIRDLIRQNPDAVYMLVQTNLVQDMVLQQSEERIHDLEDQVAELEARNRPQPQQQGSGSFLGGLFGGGSRPSAVPSTGRGQAAGFGASRAPSAGGSPWGSAPGARSMGGAPMQQGAPMPAQAAGSGGGFLRGALTTAAGVAGGMLAANAISGMLKGDQAHASPSGSGPQHQSEADDGNDAGGTYDAHSDDDNDASYGAGDDDFAEDSSSWDE
jgi:hypothetical protein